MNLINSAQAQTRLVTHGRAAPAGRLVVTIMAGAWMTVAVVGCGDDGGVYDYYDNPYDNIYDSDDAYADCDAFVDAACNYWLRCGVLAQSDYPECIVMARDTADCSRAVGTSAFYGSCMSSLRSGTCDAANQGTLPGVCNGVIFVE